MDRTNDIYSITPFPDYKIVLFRQKKDSNIAEWYAVERDEFIKRSPETVLHGLAGDYEVIGTATTCDEEYLYTTFTLKRKPAEVVFKGLSNEHYT